MILKKTIPREGKEMQLMIYSSGNKHNDWNDTHAGHWSEDGGPPTAAARGPPKSSSRLQVSGLRR